MAWHLVGLRERVASAHHKAVDGARVSLPTASLIGSPKGACLFPLPLSLAHWEGVFSHCLSDWLIERASLPTAAADLLRARYYVGATSGEFWEPQYPI